VERIHLDTDKRRWRRKPEGYTEKIRNYQFLKGRLEHCSLSHPEGLRIILLSCKFTHISYTGGKASDCSYLGYSKFLKKIYETAEVTNYKQN